jgi:hypothetical protein
MREEERRGAEVVRVKENEEDDVEGGIGNGQGALQ